MAVWSDWGETRKLAEGAVCVVSGICLLPNVRVVEVREPSRLRASNCYSALRHSALRLLFLYFLSFLKEILKLTPTAFYQALEKLNNFTF